MSAPAIPAHSRALMLILWVPLLLEIAACGYGCTLIGCEGALTIRFATPPAVTYRVEVLSVDFGQREYDCADPTKCSAPTFYGYTPTKVVITVTTATGSRQRSVEPSYQDVYANGKRCGVTCRTATVDAQLP